jgi:hypothetical protein
MGDGYLTWAEIEAKYPGEWVLLDEPTDGPDGRTAGGRLLLHTPDIDEFNRRVVELRTPNMAALRALGPMDYQVEEIECVSMWMDDSIPD